jgi:hypothetical protein
MEYSGRISGAQNTASFLFRERVNAIKKNTICPRSLLRDGQ